MIKFGITAHGKVLIDELQEVYNYNVWRYERTDIFIFEFDGTPSNVFDKTYHRNQFLLHTDMTGKWQTIDEAIVPRQMIDLLGKAMEKLGYS